LTQTATSRLWHPSTKRAPPRFTNAEYFSSAQKLAELVASWPRNRPIEVWNTFAGVAPFTDLKPVKKFTNRKVAAERIWVAIHVDLSPETSASEN
jgi:hypothetical protein